MSHSLCIESRILETYINTYFDSNVESEASFKKCLLKQKELHGDKYFTTIKIIHDVNENVNDNDNNIMINQQTEKHKCERDNTLSHKISQKRCITIAEPPLSSHKTTTFSSPVPCKMFYIKFRHHKDVWASVNIQNK